METKRFSKIPNPTRREVTEALQEIKDATDEVPFAAEEEGFPSVEKYEEAHGRRKIEPLTENEKTQLKTETEGNFHLWIQDNIPAEFQRDSRIVKYFDRVGADPKFQNIWNYQISVSEGLKPEKLIKYLFYIIQHLDKLSDIDLAPKDFTPIQTIPDFKRKIEETIVSLNNLVKVPTRDLYFRSRIDFGNGVSDYLIRKLVILKLRKILDILNDYYG
ncbi:MAG: hypothetical protein WAN61_00330 [Minisyncoccia bacterium]